MVLRLDFDLVPEILTSQLDEDEGPGLACVNLTSIVDNERKTGIKVFLAEKKYVKPDSKCLTFHMAKHDVSLNDLNYSFGPAYLKLDVNEGKPITITKMRVSMHRPPSTYKSI